MLPSAIVEIDESCLCGGRERKREGGKREARGPEWEGTGEEEEK